MVANKISLLATCLAFFVIVLGAYTRLTDAGLGCPDWPGCYGHWIVPNASDNPSQVIDSAKAWTEMLHRYFAGLLGLLIFALSFLALKNRRLPKQPLVLPLILSGLVIFQGLLGMWTVTLKLLPIVVIAHLVGGMTTLALLCWLTLQYKPVKITFKSQKLSNLRTWAILGLFFLSIQIILGGWTSANYAALACTDFPFCQTHLKFPFDLSNAFRIKSGVAGSIGAPLDSITLMSIHMLHRIGALVTTLIIGWLIFLVFFKTKNSFLRGLSIIIAGLLITQVLLGITNIVALLPLPIAVAHNAVAALLLLSLVTLNFYLYTNRQTQKHHE